MYISSCGAFMKSSVVPVYYTHLLSCPIPKMDFITEHNNRLWGCSSANREIYCSKLGSATAVSYTHLDVYKRQGELQQLSYTQRWNGDGAVVHKKGTGQILIYSAFKLIKPLSLVLCGDFVRSQCVNRFNDFLGYILSKWAGTFSVKLYRATSLPRLLLDKNCKKIHSLRIFRLYRAFEKYGFSWLSNDYELILQESTNRIADAEVVEYDGYASVNLALLEPVSYTHLRNRKLLENPELTY